MSDVVIRAEGLGKKYLIGHQSERRAGGTLRDMLTDTTRGLLRSARDMAAGRQLVAGDEVEEFWALKDINFEIKRGEVVGIIGRNGAGKSTLLKVLSRITEPTEGRVSIKGRVASLLEVGTGFHPELTGRENIYLNGAILGMSREEIRRKFDEIVDFSGVEKFLDTPVKRYSSGMYVRLAFAVAAHLEPEILIVDEVLAVGDAEFQKKSLQKIGSVALEGRTIILVSHNIGVISAFCSKGILLSAGTLKFNGAVDHTISSYMHSNMTPHSSAVPINRHNNRLPKMSQILQSIEIKDSVGTLKGEFVQSESITIEFSYGGRDDTQLAGAGIIISTTEGIRVGGFNTYMALQPPHHIPNSGTVSFSLPARQFTPGSYLVTVSIGSHQGHLVDKVEDCIGFSISQSDIYGTGYLLTKEDGVTSLEASCAILDTLP